MSQSLSARRGSMSAPDPFGEHAHLRRPSSSTITIVRVPPTTAIQEPQKLPGRRFALSSFAPQSQSRQDQHSSPSTSPSSSPRLRPRRFSGGIAGKPRLSGEQILELARQAKAAPGSTPQSPVLSHRPQSPQTHSPTPSIGQPAPATFTPLPDDIYLPFIYRTEEVSQLISTSPTAKLFSLLKQAFSPESDDDPTTTPSGDPAQWSYSQLLHHLTSIDRDVCSDADWVFAARKCIMSHSELIWERVKAALGIPPELDIEEPEEFPTAFESDESAIDDSPLVGRVDHFPAVTRTFSSSPDDASHSAPAQSPVLSGHDESEDGYVTFEPLLSTSGSNPTPLSLPTSLGGPTGLGDIAEGAEDEAEEEDNKPQEDNDLINPSQIQGLRISVGSKEPVISSPVVNVPTSVRSSSFNDLSNLSARLSMQGEGAGLSRGHTTGRSYRRKRPVSMSAFDAKEWEVPYHPVGERGPGNPLFPSNFSRLALGPTLRANNPTLRAPVMPPASRYEGRGAGGECEYAVTFASGSSSVVG
ncbi:hypothetical protein F5887DRAFT_954238 [Amanita rubescens]|nr:hypothetical protein F5887DRAFT_954238 [Amanita rubescens]